MKQTQRPSVAETNGDAVRLAVWESDGGALCADSNGAAVVATPRGRLRKVIAACRRRSRRVQQVFALVVVAVVCGLRSRAAYRAWQRQRAPVLRRPAVLRPARS